MKNSTAAMKMVFLPIRSPSLPTIAVTTVDASR
jgi:hypothetical protein